MNSIARIMRQVCNLWLSKGGPVKLGELLGAYWAGPLGVALSTVQVFRVQSFDTLIVP
jgi:hypothetical protein